MAKHIGSHHVLQPLPNAPTCVTVLATMDTQLFGWGRL